jgi:hypothetical protein
MQSERKVWCLESCCCDYSHSNLKAVDFTKAQSMQSLPFPFQLYDIALSMCTQPRPTMICLWSPSWYVMGFLQRIPPSPHHVMDAGAEPHAPTCLSFQPIMCMAFLTMHWSSSLLQSFHHQNVFFSWPCEQGIMCTSVACLPNDKLPSRLRDSFAPTI